MPSIPELIEKKKLSHQLSDTDIKDLISGIVVGKGKIEETQIGAMLMAIRLNGMNAEETVNLTKYMLESGEKLEWPGKWLKDKIVVDKHSTGGVGDKISLVLAPALASLGFKVPMISGRGLAHTGGTLDKLEALPGYTVQQSSDSIRKMVEDVGCCIVGQSKTMVPADRIMYGIRDVTSTVDSEPLIVGSIISKKAAESLNALVLDVKFGHGALYKTQESAEVLARQMVDVGNGLGIKTIGVLTHMDHPIGKKVGNALEVKEAILCLQGNGPDSIMDLVTSLGGELLLSVGKYDCLEKAKKAIEENITNGEALKKFQQMIIAQGVSTENATKVCQDVDCTGVLPKADHIYDVHADADGFVSNIDAMVCAELCKRNGSGRNQATDQLDLKVGLEFEVVVGDPVKKGDVLVKFHHSAKYTGKEFQKDVEELRNAITTSKDAPTVRSTLVSKVIK